MAIDDNYTRMFKLRSAASQLLLLFFTIAVLYAESASFKDWQARTLSSTVAIMFFVACNMALVFAPYRGYTQLKLLLWTEAALVGYLFLTAGRMELMHLFAGYWVARLPTVYRLHTSLALTAAVIVLSQVIGLARGQEWEAQRIVVMVPFYGLVLFISHMAESERWLYRETHALNQELKVAQQQLAEASRQNERLRIAREIHDVLGHQMTAQILNLEVATHQAQGVVLSRVEQSLALAKMMLGDLRNAVSDLRESPPVDFPEALRSLLARIPKLETRLDLPDDLAINDPQTTATLLRCVQEAATNTLRHSGASSFRVALHPDKDELVMEISDNGISPSSIIPGNGLVGMRERIEALAGRLHWQIPHGSLQLRISLPLRRSAIS